MKPQILASILPSVRTPRTQASRSPEVLNGLHSSANGEPDFAGMLSKLKSRRLASFCFMNRLYGFADYGGSCAFPNTGNGKYIGRFGGG